MRIAVAGAAGFVGSNLVPALQDKGHDVVALDRASIEDDVESYEIDLTDKESFEQYLDDVDVAYYLVHSMSAGDSFSEIERNCAKNFRDACEAHGVERIIFIGGIVHHDQVSEHLTSRTAVGSILANGEPSVTEFRAAMILGHGSASYEIMRSIVSKLPAIIGPRWLDSSCQPIWIEDMVWYLTEALTVEETAGEIIEVGGASTHRYRDLLAILGTHLETPLWFTATVPFLTPRLSAAWVELFADQPNPLIRALVASLREDMVVTSDTADALMPHDCLSYPETIDAIESDTATE